MLHKNDELNEVEIENAIYWDKLNQFIHLIPDYLAHLIIFIQSLVLVSQPNYKEVAQLMAWKSLYSFFESSDLIANSMEIASDTLPVQ